MLVSTWFCRGSSHRRFRNVRRPLPNRRRPGSDGRSKRSRSVHRHHAPFHCITFTHILSSAGGSMRAKCPVHLRQREKPPLRPMVGFLPLPKGSRHASLCVLRKPPILPPVSATTAECCVSCGGISCLRRYVVLPKDSAIGGSPGAGRFSRVRRGGGGLENQARGGPTKLGVRRTAVLPVPCLARKLVLAIPEAPMFYPGQPSRLRTTKTNSLQREAPEGTPSFVGPTRAV